MKKDTSKSNILIICMGFLIVFLFFKQQWALYASLSVGLVSVASSYISQKIEWLWMKLSELLGYLVPNILLGIVFFFILFPLALISRLFNKDPLMLSNKYDSYFLDVNRPIDKQSFEKPW